MKKIRIGVFFGGRSSEHEISLISAKNIIKNLDRDKYDIIPIGVDKKGEFHFGESEIFANMPLASQILEDLGKTYLSDSAIPKKIDDLKMLDVVFPVFHGTLGEDGTIQGLLRLFDIPFVGSGVLGSAIAMDKDITKRLLKNAGIQSAKHLTFHYNDSIEYSEVAAALGNVVFVKPASLGSSIGVSKAKSKSDFEKAVECAFSYDHKIIIEESINGKEIECSVLGNETPQASLLGEILVKQEFYSYSAKYLDKDGADLRLPADLSTEVSNKIREIATRAFKALCCEGMARVDFFVRDDCEIFLNEINTIPGFTEISMYPKLWEISGLAYKELLDKLIMLAMSRHDRDSKFLVKNDS